MFHIEDILDDLVQHIDDQGDASEFIQVGELTARLSDEVSTLSNMLRRTYHALEEMSSCDVSVYFRYIDGIKELDEQGQEVVAAILQDLCGDINYQLRQLTKYDRVDLD